MLSNHKIQIPDLKKIGIISFLLCCTQCIVAQNDTIADKLLDLGEVVVTGTRTPKMLKDVPVLTRVINARDIQKTDATNIQDLLQTEMPGVEFSYAMNQQVNMNLSGFAGQSVLILVDGERLAGETMDNVDFTRLSMANVERIEIVRGAASALYGSNAAGGVINIITRKTSEPWTLHLDGRWGHHNEQRYNGVWGLHRGIVSNSLAFSHTSSDNYNVKNRGTEPKTSTFAQVYGDKTLNLSDQISLAFSKNLNVTGKLGFFRRTMDRVSDSQERYRDYQGGLSAQWRITERDYLEASYNFDQYDKSDYLRTRSLDVRKYSNVQNSLRMLYNHNMREANVLTCGADFMYDYLMNSNLNGNAHRQQAFDTFAQYDWRIDRHWELLGALRYDYFSDGSTSRLTPKLSARWSPHRRLTVRSSYGMGFRAPTLKEKYYNFDMAGIWIVEGNAGLQPEVSHNFTLGAEYRYNGYSVNVSGNYNRVNGRITTGLPYHKDDTQQWYLAYINLGDMNVFSIEANINANFGHGFTAKASYMLTHEEQTSQTANQYMPARKHSLTLRGDWDHEFGKHFGLNVSLSGRALSSVSNNEYYDLSTPERGTHEVIYPAYSLWKMQVVGRLKKWMKLTLTVDNIFNYRPEYYYYNAPLTQGINLMGGVSFDIDKIF